MTELKNLNEIENAVIKFTGENCAGCKIIQPILEKIEADYPQYSFYTVSVDTENGSQIASMCGVSSLPTLMKYENGEKVSQMTGARPERLIRNWIDEE